MKKSKAWQQQVGWGARLPAIRLRPRLRRCLPCYELCRSILSRSQKRFPGFLLALRISSKFLSSAGHHIVIGRDVGRVIFRPSGSTLSEHPFRWLSETDGKDTFNVWRWGCMVHHKELMAEATRVSVNKNRSFAEFSAHFLIQFLLQKLICSQPVSKGPRKTFSRKKS